jgi:rRNA processing protein Gar1
VVGVRDEILGTVSHAYFTVDVRSL